MKTVTNSVRQHWVPKMYLRNFCVEESVNQGNPLVHVYDIKTGGKFCASLNNIFLEKHLYTIGRDSVVPLYVVEKTLSKIESWAAPSVDQLSKGKAIHCDPESRIYLSYFFATLLLRNPSIRLAQEKGFKSLSEEAPPSLPKGMSEGEYEEAKKVHKWYSELDGDGKHIVFVRSILNAASIVSADFRDRPWYLFRANEGSFVTSDCPVVVYHPYEKSYGVGTPGVQIHIAVSPKLVLWIGCEVKFDEEKVHDIPRDLVEYVNHLRFGALTVSWCLPRSLMMWKHKLSRLENEKGLCKLRELAGY